VPLTGRIGAPVDVELGPHRREAEVFPRRYRRVGQRGGQFRPAVGGRVVDEHVQQVHGFAGAEGSAGGGMSRGISEA
jgi:hypothetical protein